MGERIETIMGEYKNADFENRLYMFMVYSELRDQFMEIDSSESSDQITAKSASLQKTKCCRPFIESVVKAIKKSFLTRGSGYNMGKSGP